VGTATFLSLRKPAAAEPDSRIAAADEPAPVAPPGGAADDSLPAGAVVRLGSNRLRIGAASLAVTPDGKTLVAVSAAGVGHRFDAATGKGLGSRVLGDRDHMYSTFYGYCLSDDASTAAILEENLQNGGCTVWDVATGRRLLRREEVTRCALSPDGKAAAVVEYDRSVAKNFLRLYDLAGGKPRDVAQLPNVYVIVLRFSPDGKCIVSNSVDGQGQNGFTVFELTAGKKPWDVAPANEFGFSADGRTLFTWSRKGAIRMRAVDVETRNPVEGFKPPPNDTVAGRMVGLPDGRSLLVPLSSGDVAVWDYRDGRELRRFKTTPLVHSKLDPAVSADGRSVFANSEGLHGWRLTDGVSLFGPSGEAGHAAEVQEIAFLPGGKEIVSTALDESFLRWSLADFRRSGSPVRNAGPAVWVTSAGVRTARADWSRLTIRSVPDKEVVGRLNFPDDRTPRTPEKEWRYALLADGTTVLTYQPRPNKAVVAATDYTGKTLYEAEVPPPSASTCFQAFSPCGRWLVAYGEVYSVRSGKKLWTPTVDDVTRLDPLCPASFSPDGRFLCGSLRKQGGIARGAGFAVWEMASGAVVFRSDFRYTCQFAVGPDGRSFAYLTAVGFSFVDLATGSVLTEYGAPDVSSVRTNIEPRTVVFSPDGKTVATGHYDGTILLWRTPALPAEKSTDADLPSAWNDLTGADAAKAIRTADRLAREPAGAVALLSAKYDAPPGVDVPALIRDLDSPEFAKRERATEKLRNSGLPAEPALRDALKTAAPEAKRRIERVLDSLGATSEIATHGEGLRAVRAVGILERANTDAARKLLREWADRPADSVLKTEARLALQRLSLR
jgi:WD40 repeat protein